MLNNTTDSLIGTSLTSHPPQQQPTPPASSTVLPSSTSTTAMSSSRHVGGAATTILVAVSDVPVERTAIGIPVKLLWVPYIIFTLVVISLIMVSFCKYHRKHGHKYRRRRRELFGKGSHQFDSGGGLPRQLPRGCATTGATHLPPNGGAPSAVCCNAEMASTSVPQQHRQQQEHYRATHSNPTNSSSTVKKKPKPRRKQKPLTFMRNANGSMVDLRCGERNSMNIFKTPFSTHVDSSIWTLPRHGGAYRTLNSPTGNYFSDEDDDDVLLIHSTKL